MKIYPQESEIYEPMMSQALPFMTRTAILYGSMAGDVGVDLIGFALSEENMRNLRYSEIKHKKIANAFHLNPILGHGDTAASVLNKGLLQLSPMY